jgi:ABC-type antimicrobial peptide transport system permease subunit
MVDEWWVDVPSGQARAYLAAHPSTHGVPAAKSRDILAQQMQQNPLRVATQAALWLAILAAALLAAVGFAVHTAAAMRSRRLEFAELRAIGLSRGKLIGLIAVESLLLAVLGIVFGMGVGALLSWLVAPLVAVSPDGTPAVPSVIVDFPVGDIGLLVLGLVAVLACVVLLVARMQRVVQPADLLRGAGE